MNMAGELFIPTQRLCAISFSTYSADEIKKISCKRITNVETFDSLMHPNPGGLHVRLSIGSRRQGGTVRHLRTKLRPLPGPHGQHKTATTRIPPRILFKSLQAVAMHVFQLLPTVSSQAKNQADGGTAGVVRGW